MYIDYPTSLSVLSISTREHIDGSKWFGGFHMLNVTKDGDTGWSFSEQSDVRFEQAATSEQYRNLAHVLDAGGTLACFHLQHDLYILDMYLRFAADSETALTLAKALDASLANCVDVADLWGGEATDFKLISCARALPSFAMPITTESNAWEAQNTATLEKRMIQRNGFIWQLLMEKTLDPDDMQQAINAYDAWRAEQA